MIFDVEALYVGDDGGESKELITVSGTGKAIVDRCASYVYEVVSGDGTFEISDMTIMSSKVSGGSDIMVPNGVTHRFEGDLVMLRTSTPAFDPDTVTVVE